MVYLKSFLDIAWLVILFQLAWYDFYYQILPFKLISVLGGLTLVNLVYFTASPDESLFFMIFSYSIIKLLSEIYQKIHKKKGIGEGDLILYPFLLQWILPKTWSLMLLCTSSMIILKSLLNQQSKRKNRPSKISLGAYLIAATLLIKMHSLFLGI